MTRTEYQRRVAHLIHATEWGADNPFRGSALSRLCGLHSPPPTDHESPATEAKIALAFETALAKSEEATPF